MNISEYSNLATGTTQQNTRDEPLKVYILGLLGELGSLATLLKKRTKELADGVEHQSPAAARVFIEEVGDILWYANALACEVDTTLSEIMQQSLVRVTSDDNQSLDDSFETYQEKVQVKLRGELADSDRLEEAVGQSIVVLKFEPQFEGFLKNASQLLSLNSEKDEAKMAMRKSLGDLIFYCAQISGYKLETAAKTNLSKINKLYKKTDEKDFEFFDDDFPPDEQFPRKFTVVFHDIVSEGDKRTLRLSINGVIIGDRLGDNADNEDFYRYHDVFHLAYLAVLGWSPVARKLLNRKRKSSKDVDENQDGARARIIEEAVAIMVFQFAKQRKYLTEKYEIDEDLLKVISQLTLGLEVNNSRTMADWREAIELGFRIFNELKEKKGGAVFVDLENRTLVYNPCPASDEIYRPSDLH